MKLLPYSRVPLCTSHVAVQCNILYAVTDREHGHMIQYQSPKASYQQNQRAFAGLKCLK